MIFLALMLWGCFSPSSKQNTNTTGSETLQDKERAIPAKDEDPADKDIEEVTPSTEKPDLPEITSSTIDAELAEKGFKEISVDEAYEIFISNEDFLFVDVRSKEEYDSGHVKGAIHIPAAQLEDRIKEIPQAKITVVYCIGKGCSSSTYAAKILVSHGFTQIYKMGGIGIIEWMQKEYPTE